MVSMNGPLELALSSPLSVGRLCRRYPRRAELDLIDPRHRRSLHYERGHFDGLDTSG